MTGPLHRPSTRAIAVVVAAMTALVACVAVAPAASAKSDTKFCDAVDTLESKLSDVDNVNA